MCKKLRQESIVAFETSLFVDEEVKFDRALARAPRSPRLFCCPITGEGFLDSDGATIGWDHLSALVRAAVVDAGFQGVLPWNISNMVNAGVAPGRYPRHVSRAGARMVVEKVSRFCGWLKAAAGLYALRRVIERTQSPNGMWSPRTTIHLWRLAARYPAPHALERKLWGVRARATSILAAYEGQKPSWASIAQALMATAMTGKAAVIAVAISLSGNSYFRSYCEAREWLVDYHLCSVADGGIRREAAPCLIRGGMEVWRIATPRVNLAGHRIGVMFEFEVRAAGARTFIGGGTPELASEEATRAWKYEEETGEKW